MEKQGDQRFLQKNNSWTFQEHINTFQEHDVENIITIDLKGFFLKKLNLIINLIITKDKYQQEQNYESRSIIT